MKKHTFSLKAAVTVFLCFALVFPLCGCGLGALFAPSKSAVSQEPVVIESGPIAEPEAILPIFEPFVTDAYVTTVTYEQQLFCYHIPQVNLDGEAAAAFNEKIYTKYYEMIANNVLAGQRDWGYPALDEIHYVWGEKDGVISILIEYSATMEAHTVFSVYTLSAETGKEISSSNTYEVFGLSETEYFEQARAALQAYWDAQSADLQSIIGSDFFQSLVERTLSDENVKNASPYINEKGQLCFLAEVFSPAGADSYPHLFNLETGEETSFPVCSQNHSEPETPMPTESTEPTIAVSSGAITDQDLWGAWTVDTDYTMEINQKSIMFFYGTSFNYFKPYLIFNQDGTCEYAVGSCSGRGSYKLTGNQIRVTFTEGDPIASTATLLITTDGVTRIAMDQYENGEYVFWVKT